MTILDFVVAAGAKLPNLNFGTPDWAIWKKDAAVIVTNEDEIEQCLILIATTALGSDPLRPEFGSDFLPCIDLPVNLSGPLLIARTTAALTAWEPRARVLGLTVAASTQGRVSFTLTWERVAGRAGQPRTSTFSL